MLFSQPRETDGHQFLTGGVTDTCLPLSVDPKRQRPSAWSLRNVLTNNGSRFKTLICLTEQTVTTARAQSQ